jgi:PIN domain nuclease of toxin-antitoxin system
VSAVLDASAILAFLRGETGAGTVESELDVGALCGAANWSEVAQKIRAADGDWDLARALLLAYKIEIVPAVVEDAEWAALRWQRGEGLSLADRLCLALAERMDLDVLTADTVWGGGGRIRQIR